MDFEKLFDELENEDNLVNRLAIDGLKINRGKIDSGVSGRRPGDVNVPPICRELIAVQSVIGMEGLEEKFGISKESINKYEKGRVSSLEQIEKRGKSKSDRELEKNLDTMLGRVRDKALDRVMEAMELMDGDKMKACNAKELSQITSNLARVVAATTPKQDNGNTNTQFNTIIYAPESKKESDYEVVQVG